MEKKFRLLLLLALLLTAATGAWAQSAFTAKEITSASQLTSTDDEAYVAACMPSDFLAVDAVVAKAWTGAPTDGSAILIYAIDGDKIKMATFINGSNKVTTGATWSIASFKNQLTNGKFFYTAPPTYSITLAEGTEDANKWTIEPTEAAAGSPVTATYSGEKKVKSVKAVKKEADPLAVPLTIEAITAGSITVSNPKEGMQYSLNGGAKTAVTTGDIAVAAGDKVQFYGNGTSITSYGGSSLSESTKIDGSGNGFTCKVYGNIMSLVDEENFATAKTLSEAYAFSFLFYRNTTLTDASGLLLPATTLGDNCYDQMFKYCTALTAAPALPATQLAASCYSQMFRVCTALTTAPVLPAETLVERCYYQMFYQCSNLATVTCLATSGSGQSNSTNQWLQSAGTQVQGAKFIYTVGTANWPTGNNGIPSGWQRNDVDN